MIPSFLTVHAAIRFSPADSIGVPVFMSGNSMYLPEMDADFAISAFLDFDNEDGYELTFDIPDIYRQRGFQLGDPAPIIFWVRNTPHIVEGDAEKAKLEEIFGLGARTHPVLRDLGDMLDDARTGKIKAQQEEWLAQDIAAAYQDVFLDPPSRTKYWISRYRSALETARQITKPPHPVDVRLRRASTEWLERFATKAELPMIGALLGEAIQGIYSARQITEIMFAYLSHRLPSLRGTELAKVTSDETIKSLFRHGLYDFYLQNGWPHVPFKYNQSDFVAIMKDKLADGASRGSWTVALLAAQVVFGDRDAPREVDDVALLYIREVIQQYQAAHDAVDNDHKEMRFGREEMTYYARLIVDRFDRINELSCIMHGADRITGKMMWGRFQVFEDDVQRYRTYLAD